MFLEGYRCLGTQWEEGFRKGAEKMTNFGSFACGPVGGNVFLESVCVYVSLVGYLSMHLQGCRPLLPSGKLQLLYYAWPVSHPVVSTDCLLSDLPLHGRKVKEGKAEGKNQKENYTYACFTFHFPFDFN